MKRGFVYSHASVRDQMLGRRDKVRPRCRGLPDNWKRYSFSHRQMLLREDVEADEHLVAGKARNLDESVGAKPHVTVVSLKVWQW